MKFYQLFAKVVNLKIFKYRTHGKGCCFLETITSHSVEKIKQESTTCFLILWTRMRWLKLKSTLKLYQKPEESGYFDTKTNRKISYYDRKKIQLTVNILITTKFR